MPFGKCKFKGIIYFSMLQNMQNKLLKLVCRYFVAMKQRCNDNS